MRAMFIFFRVCAFVLFALCAFLLAGLLFFGAPIIVLQGIIMTGGVGALCVFQSRQIGYLLD